MITFTALRLLHHIYALTSSIESLDQLSFFRHGIEKLEITESGVSFEIPKISTKLNNFALNRLILSSFSRIAIKTSILIHQLTPIAKPPPMAVRKTKALPYRWRALGPRLWAQSAIAL